MADGTVNIEQVQELVWEPSGVRDDIDGARAIRVWRRENKIEKIM
jgi:hypothetical protein